MSDAIQVFGEFHLTSALARKVHHVVREIITESTLKELSHVDDSCALCRSQEEGGDVSQPDRAGREWLA